MKEQKREKKLRKGKKSDFFHLSDFVFEEAIDASNNPSGRRGRKTRNTIPNGTGGAGGGGSSSSRKTTDEMRNCLQIGFWRFLKKKEIFKFNEDFEKFLIISKIRWCDLNLCRRGGLHLNAWFSWRSLRHQRQQWQSPIAPNQVPRLSLPHMPALPICGSATVLA